MTYRTARTARSKSILRGTLGATIKGGTLIARDAGGRIIGRHEIAPGYASAPYDSTRLKVPGFRPAEVAKIDLTLRGSPDGFDNTVFAWSRSFLLETQGTSLSVKAISPIDVSVLDPGKG
ncbi:hypothetical protein [Pseudodonghicola xiamenensis]|uniref:hypothetical protein n=1 Tax=Pseudodonghicola xiamenensis TaxID=337702 RepID=UPI0012B601C4|nr:hypothetical protein [Pseudodonghicola xiamenensis]